MVLAEDLAAVIRPIIDEQTKAWERVKHGKGFAMVKDANAPAPLSMLEMRSGVPARTIYRILSGESEIVDLDIADRICLGLYLNISIALEEEMFYPAGDLFRAMRVQSELMWQIAKVRGYAIPETGSEERRRLPGQLRRRWAKERMAA